MNHFINLTYFSVRLLILSLSDPKISSLPSSAHTYRLLIFKEHFCEDPEAFSAALRFQQQRSEIMNRFFQFVNNFLTTSLRRLGFNFLHRRGRYDPPDSTASLLLPRCVSVSAKEA
ncbi:hypothetical protein [Burkholderia sp. Bp8984]|uniref:hypothetical protein n=2 Tax=Burkholderia TaxID=32008 RepID=UPI00162502B7|nr:hypothetical protein [Burkholderia sp. Bp8984]